MIGYHMATIYGCSTSYGSTNQILALKRPFGKRWTFCCHFDSTFRSIFDPSVVHKKFTVALCKLTICQTRRNCISDPMSITFYCKTFFKLQWYTFYLSRHLMRVKIDFDSKIIITQVSIAKINKRLLRQVLRYFNYSFSVKSFPFQLFPCNILLDCS